MSVQKQLKVRQEHLNELVTNRLKAVSSSCLVTGSRTWLEVVDLMSCDVRTACPQETVLSAARSMAAENVSSLVVVDREKVVGIVTETDLLKKVVGRQVSSDKVTIADVMSSPVVSVPPEMSVFEAGEVAERRNVKRLPVIKDDVLIGIVTRTDLVRVLTSYGMWREIGEIMTRSVASISPDASVARAAEMMNARGISGIVVTAPEGVAGILTERDFLKRVVAAGKNPESTPVREVMSHPVVTVPSYYSVFSCSRIMEKMQVRRLVVEDSRRVCGIVTQTDIFRAVENRLREEEEQNLQLLERSDACIYTLDLQGNITYVNPAFMKLLHVSDRTELVGHSFLPEKFWFDPQYRLRFLKELKSGAIDIMDLTLRTAHSRRIDVTMYSSFTRNMHGKMNGSQGVLHDITDKKELVTLKETRKALEASEERYRRITDAVTDYMFTVRFESGRPVETIHSQASTAVTGYSPEELTTEPGLWFNMVHPDDWELVREQTSQCISGQEIRPIEHRLIRRDGGIRWVRRTLVRNCDRAGRILSYDGLLQDVTELKLAEQVQTHLLSELKHATEELGEFAYIASHDLKVPLRGISALANWLNTDYADKFDEEGRENVKQLVSRVRRMYNLIDGVLQYAKVTRTRERHTEVNLNELVGEVIDRLEPPQNIEIVLARSLPAVLCAPGGMKDVFYNLLDNAVTYMDKPRGKITVDCTEEKSAWKFAVSDNGPGIDKKHHERIFRMFQTLASYQPSEKVGVGLTIARKIIEQHGGRIWVESKPGEGSTFHFILPKAGVSPGHTRLTPALAVTSD